MSLRNAGSSASVTTRLRPKMVVAYLPPPRATIGISILPVMSPPMSSTSQP